MISGNISIQETLSGLGGMAAWGLVRTYGSMFFLEIGNPLPRIGEKKVHGEWHFLVEICAWRLDSHDAILVGSDDQQELIDSRFLTLKLGTVKAAKVHSPAHDLEILFSSGLRLRTFSSIAAPKEAWTQWQLYGPDDYVWAVDATGGLVYENAHG